jgi:hypothetical protein
VAKSNDGQEQQLLQRAGEVVGRRRGRDSFGRRVIDHAPMSRADVIDHNFVVGFAQPPTKL